jgi:hypothetical protein
LNLTPEQIAEIATKAALAAVNAAQSSSTPQVEEKKISDMTPAEIEAEGKRALVDVDDRLDRLAAHDPALEAFINEHLPVRDKLVFEWWRGDRGVSDAVLAIMRGYIASQKASYREATSDVRIASTKTKTESALNRAAGY